ncbi:MBL fold metallo-hydrolase [Geminicoccus roseus]|uniref:MBL fold metallo-hydrolase n=1 Tax=Geminicoccus roseus TaxID=404900 RepID=UPI00040A5B57|nr:MBL fold metallo-hydrolase [Geminicoccus roseus]
MRSDFSLGRRDMLAAGAGVAAAGAFAMSGPVSTARAATPMQDLARPSFYRFDLGGFRVTTLLDGYVQGDGPHPIFGQDQPAEAVHELAQMNFLPPEKMENSFTPVLVNTGSELVLFDTGNAPARRPNAGNLVETMKAAGYEPGQVSVVVITHMHGDHIGGLMTDGQPTFPNARYVTGQAEYDFWAADERLSGPTENGAKLFRANMMPLADKTSFLADGGEAVPGITAVAAFGHTPGHMAYHLESDGQRLLLWADTANHYVVSVQRPEWHVQYDMDKEAAGETRKRIFDMAAADRIPVTGYHMPFPALGFIDRHPDRYLWVPVSYQLNV